MTETVPEKTVTEEIEETESIENQTEETKPAFKIESLDDLKRLLTIAQGGDPDAQQAIVSFLDLDSKVQKSYFPDRITTLAIAQLKGFGNALYGSAENNAYDVVADVIADAYMGFKGFKSNQFVDMTRQTPNLDALTSHSEESKQGFVSRILGRGKD